MLDGFIGDVFVLVVGKCVTQEQVVTLLEPCGVAFVFLVTDEAVLCG